MKIHYNIVENKEIVTTEWLIKYLIDLGLIPTSTSAEIKFRDVKDYVKAIILYNSVVDTFISYDGATVITKITKIEFINRYNQEFFNY